MPGCGKRTSVTRLVFQFPDLWIMQTTGSTHLERGQNFIAMLEDMDGGIPEKTTYDYIEGVSHDSTAMIYSDQGIDKVS
jgi:hypothetical protein